MTQSTDADAVSAVGLVAAWTLDHALAAEKALAVFTAGGATGAELMVTALAVAAVVIAHVIAAVMTWRATMPAVECHVRRAGVVGGQYTADQHEEVSDMTLIQSTLDC